MTICITIWKDEDYYSGNINGEDFNKITKDTLLDDISLKMNEMHDLIKA